MLKTKLWVFLKQIQPRIIVNQHVSRMCIKVQGNRENQKWKKQSKHKIITAIKALRDIKNLLGKSGNFHNNNYIESESNGDRNNTLSNEWHFNKVRPYSKDITNNLIKSDTW